MEPVIHGPLAFGAGVVSFLSPCVLPLLPAFLALMVGLSLRESVAFEGFSTLLKKSVVAGAVFVLGFSAIFTILGAFASGFGAPLSPHVPKLKKVAGLFIVLFGAASAFRPSFPSARFYGDSIGVCLIGAAFAFGWTPCVGPVLSGILALAGADDSVSRGMFLLFVYSLGIGVPFVLMSFVMSAALPFFRPSGRLLNVGRIAAAALLAGAGILIAADRFSSLANSFSFFRRFAL